MNRDRQMDLGDGVLVEVIDAALATPLEHAKAISKQRTLDEIDEPFFLADLSAVVSQLRHWRAMLPRVEPFYAVKCNDDPAVLRTLAVLGVGFDCASKLELRRVLQLGVQPDRIIYGNPCKQTSVIGFVRDANVHLMTFDNVDELYKVKENFPDAKMVLRISPHGGRVASGNRFGAPYESVARLIRTAKSLEVDIVGVSFHVGSECADVQHYVQALRLARRVVDDLLAAEYTPQLVDLGGGFPGSEHDVPSFNEIAAALVPVLDQLFPPSSGIRLIAEPGRYMVARAFVLMTNVIAKRVPNAASCACCSLVAGNEHTNTREPCESCEPCEQDFVYYLNDGVYGSFSRLLYDQSSPPARVAKRVPAGSPRFRSALYGPTCDSLDCLAHDAMLPELLVGDWLYFEHMGAYSLSSSDFNNMRRPDRFYVINKSDAMLFHRELAAMVAEKGAVTSDLMSLIGESFVDEVLAAATAAALAEVDVAAHRLELRDEVKSALEEFRQQCDDKRSAEDSAIAHLETLLNAISEENQSNTADDEHNDELDGDEKRETHNVRRDSGAAGDGESNALRDEPAVTLIFD